MVPIGVVESRGGREWIWLNFLEIFAGVRYVAVTFKLRRKRETRRRREELRTAIEETKKRILLPISWRKFGGIGMVIDRGEALCGETQQSTFGHERGSCPTGAALVFVLPIVRRAKTTKRP